MKWHCWSGAENSFLISDEWNDQWSLSKDLRPEFATKQCSQFINAQVDGLIYLKKIFGYDFEWEFYNSDGSFAEMCGNAARCVTGYYRDRIDQSKKELKFISLAGEIQTELVEKNLVQVLMPAIQVLDSKPGNYFLVNTGVPHVVIEGPPKIETAAKWRNFGGNRGANVTFVEEVNNSAIRAVTFERGVEGFTKACGTGAVACAAYFNQRNYSKKRQIQMPGGILTVENAIDKMRPTLTGDARFHYALEIETKEKR
jgi:diaminopimelate epimerase